MSGEVWTHGYAGQQVWSEDGLIEWVLYVEM